MIESWYAPDVSFDDPLTSLTGVGSYRDNVDMLAGRTMLGRAMFDGARIDLHSVTGGGILSEATGGIADVVTRWTLKVTVRVLPWKPEAVFSGVSPSAYDVQVYLEKIADEHGMEWTPRVPMRVHEMYEPTRAPTGDTCEPLLKQIEMRWKFCKYMLNSDNPRDCIWSYSQHLCKIIFFTTVQCTFRCILLMQISPPSITVRTA